MVCASSSRSSAAPAPSELEALGLLRLLLHERVAHAMLGLRGRVARLELLMQRLDLHRLRLCDPLESHTSRLGGGEALALRLEAPYQSNVVRLLRLDGAAVRARLP